MDSLLESRKKQLMGGVSAADSRLRRARNTIKIGKSKRLESRQKRRGASSAAATAKANAEVVQTGGSLPKELSVENLPLYYNGLWRQLPQRRHNRATQPFLCFHRSCDWARQEPAV